MYIFAHLFTSFLLLLITHNTVSAQHSSPVSPFYGAQPGRQPILTLAQIQTVITGLQERIVRLEAEQKTDKAKIRQLSEKLPGKGSSVKKPSGHGEFPSTIVAVETLERTVAELKNIQRSEKERITSTIQEVNQIKEHLEKKPKNGSNYSPTIDPKAVSLRGGLPPLGFIYFQLPSQSEPTRLYPGSVWRDISSLYSGVFFRVVGKGAMEFEGGIQADNAPRMANASYHRGTAYDIYYGGLNTCGWIHSGSEGPVRDAAIQYCTSGGEVRPRNVAIKVWKRVT